MAEAVKKLFDYQIEKLRKAEEAKGNKVFLKGSKEDLESPSVQAKTKH